MVSAMAFRFPHATTNVHFLHAMANVPVYSMNHLCSKYMMEAVA
jgi:hypothetical protein